LAVANILTARYGNVKDRAATGRGVECWKYESTLSYDLLNKMGKRRDERKHEVFR